MRSRGEIEESAANSSDTEMSLEIAVEVLLDIRDLLQKAEDRMVAMEARFDGLKQMRNIDLT